MKTIEVCAGIVRRAGMILVCSRPKDSGLAGFWEFPGGKVEQGETLFECIKRELAEELSLSVEPIHETADEFFDYPDKRVHLHFIECSASETAVITPNDNQDFAWIAPENLEKVNFLPGDRAFVRDFLMNTSIDRPEPENSGTCQKDDTL